MRENGRISMPVETYHKHLKLAKEEEKEKIYYGIISIFEEFKEESPTYCIGLFMNVVLKELKLKKGE